MARLVGPLVSPRGPRLAHTDALIRARRTSCNASHGTAVVRCSCLPPLLLSQCAPACFLWLGVTLPLSLVQRFPMDYNEAIRQAQDSVKAALADGATLLEVEFPTASLASVPGDEEGANEMTQVNEPTPAASAAAAAAARSQTLATEAHSVVF